MYASFIVDAIEDDAALKRNVSSFTFSLLVINYMLLATS
jgi:hypothetical protein